VIKNKENMKNKKKEYVLVSVGGMNSECILGVNRFGDIDEVIEYCDERGVCDNNEVRFRNSYIDKEVDDGGGWMSDDYMCECYDDVVDEKIVRVYGINEGLEMLEVEVK
jgi:hypothetical protein